MRENRGKAGIERRMWGLARRESRETREDGEKKGREFKKNFARMENKEEQAM